MKCSVCNSELKYAKNSPIICMGHQYVNLKNNVICYYDIDCGENNIVSYNGTKKYTRLSKQTNRESFVEFYFFSPIEIINDAPDTLPIIERLLKLKAFL